MSAREDMLEGRLYDAQDPELVAMRRRARALSRAFEATVDDVERERILRELLGGAGANLVVEPPLRVDYGCHVFAGKNVYVNFGCVILDCAHVTIGDDVQIGPNVIIATATHPVDPDERAKGPELARPIRIGSKAWIGAGAILCPGVTIGEGSTIGAGSVVTKDVPARVVAAGNPCRVIRTLGP